MTETTEVVMRLKGLVPCPMCLPGDNRCSLCVGMEWVTKEVNEQQYGRDWFLAPNAEYSDVRGNLKTLFDEATAEIYK